MRPSRSGSVDLEEVEAADEDDEAKLLQELADLDARIEEKQVALEGIAIREQTLRQQLVVSQGEARSLSEQAAKLERELSYAEIASINATATAALRLQQDSPDPAQALAEALEDVDEDEDDEAVQMRARARLAMGLGLVSP